MLSAGKYEILSSGNHTSFHLFAVVSSLGALSSQANTVTANFLGSNPKKSGEVKNSRDHVTASFLK
ncbi:hypothetical protein J6V86_02300 [bacterium]|nr:hypothetical protein [bacterium]